jgi:hypothetical protein
MHLESFSKCFMVTKKVAPHKHVPISVVYINELWTMLHSNYYHIGAMHVVFLVLTQTIGRPKRSVEMDHNPNYGSLPNLK